MFQASDGRGVRVELGFLRPGAVTPTRLTRTQVKWFSNLIGSWLVYGVGLSVRDAAAVLSRTVTENHLRRNIHRMEPVAALPDPNGFQNGWRFELREAPDRRPRRKPRRRLPRTAPAGRGRTSTARRTTSTGGSPAPAPG